MPCFLKSKQPLHGCLLGLVEWGSPEQGESHLPQVYCQRKGSRGFLVVKHSHTAVQLGMRYRHEGVTKACDKPFQAKHASPAVGTRHKMEEQHSLKASTFPG